jgi:ATP-dependent Clp protease ATP-binding subunit ClpA
MLKPALARGELRLIGATTLDEYRKHVEKDGALERRFQPVLVGEPSVEEALPMLQAVRPHYEQHHGVQIADEALQAAVKLADRYITDRFLPDKAIDLIDEAAAALRLEAAERGEGPHHALDHEQPHAKGQHDHRQDGVDDAPRDAFRLCVRSRPRFGPCNFQHLARSGVQERCHAHPPGRTPGRVTSVR